MGDIYFSYHLRDSEKVCFIGFHLGIVGYPIWIDSIVPIADDDEWTPTLRHAREQAKLAIVLWSNSYDTSRYCQDEFAELVRTKKRIIILQSTAKIPKNYLKSASQVIAFQTQSNTTLDYNQALNTLKSSLQTSMVEVTEEYIYLLKLLHQIDIKLIKQPTALAVQNCENYAIRPRLYHSSVWLTKGDYDVAIVADSTGQISKIGIQDVKDWLRINPQLLVSGDSDTGKTSLLLHITRLMAHQRLEQGTNVAMPLYVDLQNWCDGSFSEFIQATVAQLPSDHTSQIMYIIDDVRGDLLSYKQIVEIQTWASHEQDRAAIIATDLDVAEQFDWIFPYLQLNTLSEQQSSAIHNLVPANDSALQESDTHTLSLDTIAHEMLVKSILSAEKIDKQIYALIIDAYSALDDSYSRKASAQQVKVNLQKLALHTIEKATPFAITRTSALHCVNDDMILQHAIALGLLETFGDKLAFTSDNLRQFLAAEAIYIDGVYAHIERPHLQPDSSLKSTYKERFIRHLPTYLHDVDLIGILETTAQVNPYLALDFYSQWQMTMPTLLHAILQNLLMLPDSLWSLPVCSKMVQPLVNQNPSQIADALLKLLQNEDAHIHERIYNLINSVWHVRNHFYTVLSNIEVDFPDAALSDIDSVQQSSFIVTLLQIAQSKHSKYRITTLGLLGTLRINASVTLLQSIIWSESAKPRDTALQALTTIDHSKVLQTLFYAIAAAPTKTKREKIIAELALYGRELSGRLLMWICDEEYLDKLIDVIVSNGEHVILLHCISYCRQMQFAVFNNLEVPETATTTLNEGESHGMKDLLDALAKKMPSLKNQPAFEKFLHDVLSHLRQRDEPDNDDIEYVKERLRGMSRKRHLDEGDNRAPEITLPHKLILSLEHSNWIIRRKAVERLASYPPEQAIPSLLKAAKDDDLQVRIAALEGFPLSHLNDEMLQALLDSLLIDDFLLAETAANRIRELDDSRVTQLLSLLDDAPTNALAVIIGLLGESGDERAVKALKPYLTDARKPWLETKTLGELTASALLQIGTDDARAAVIAVYPAFMDTTPVIILPDTEDLVADELTNILNDLQGDEWQLSQEAAKKLREYAKRRRGEPARSVATYLEQYLDADNWTVRWAIIEALAWLQVPETIDTISPRLHDENWTVCIAAIRTLMELDATQCDQEIAKLLTSDNSTVREAAAEALGVLHTERTVKLLRPALADEDDFVRLAAVKSLITISGKEATELLIAHQDEYHHVRWHIAQYLTSFNSAKLLRVYVKMLADDSKPEWEEQTVREIAEVAISKIDTEEARNVLNKWRQIRKNN